MHQSAQSIYTSCEGHRYQYVDRARQCSTLTLPYVMPDEGFGAHSRLNTPFQGVGARGVNNLSSKLLLALLPPNAPFFRLNVDLFALQQEGAPPEVVTEIESSLQQIEEAVMDEISRESYRTGIHEALKQLIVTGNALVYIPDEGGLRVFRLDRYIVKRDPMGNVTTIATKETLSYKTLTDEMKAVVGEGDVSENVNLYTAIVLDGDQWRIFQDINGNPVPNSEGTYAKDKNPFIPLRFTRIDGEDYGRGYVEEYLGDLQSLEKLTQAIVEGSAARQQFILNHSNSVQDNGLFGKSG